MHRSYHRWDSPALGRSMELLVFGHGGAPCLVFPTSMGRFFEFEDRGMVAALSHQLEQGWLQLICVDSIDAETWYNYGWDTNARLFRHDQFEHYLLTEVLPFVHSINSDQYLMATGCSWGAMHAVNLTLRHPGVVKRVIGLSGLYDIRRFFSTYTDSVYFHNPVDFVAGMDDQWRLDRLRETDIILATGRDDPNVESNHRLSGVLWGKGVGNALRIWDGWSHDWPYWVRMINQYISGHD
ncbi:MAG: alpha/beta hydrolase-fold protein [Chloroflexaceae bacterium]|jgi:esterase/lipase superfamily enzyme|nr:alpha/beta hydrolase-fold protein [Chloroflexaceae bacterium]